MRTKLAFSTWDSTVAIGRRTTECRSCTRQIAMPESRPSAMCYSAIEHEQLCLSPGVLKRQRPREHIFNRYIGVGFDHRTKSVGRGKYNLWYSRTIGRTPPSGTDDACRWFIDGPASPKAPTAGQRRHQLRRFTLEGWAKDSFLAATQSAVVARRCLTTIHSR